MRDAYYNRPVNLWDTALHVWWSDMTFCYKHAYLGITKCLGCEADKVGREFHRA